LLKGHFEPTSPVALFLFSGTLFIYSAHRLYGLQTSRPVKGYLYYKFSSLLKANTVAGALACLFCWLQLPATARWHTLAASLLALAYILPVLPGHRRLREVAMLKIFLLAACWSWLTVIVPAVASGMGWSALTPLMALERAAFIFIIAIGFDLRDRKRDVEAGLATLPVRLGDQGAVLCAAFSLLIAWGIAWIYVSASFYPPAAFYSVSVSGVLALFLVARAGRKDLSPYYFLFGLDGMMMLQFLLVLF